MKVVYFLGTALNDHYYFSLLVEYSYGDNNNSNSNNNNNNNNNNKQLKMKEMI